MNPRRMAAGELAALGTLSAGFLLLFPHRPILVDVGLAVCALGLILLNAGYTKAAIWDRFPLEVERSRWQRCVASTMILTVPALILFLGLGMYIGYERGGQAGIEMRLLHPRIPMAIALYFPWALVQQTLFQFYLLGRLRVLWPSLPPRTHAALNGLAFGLVHAPDLWIAAMTWLGGTVWSFLYLRYRLLWPLALSHALLGTTFYYWVYGQDLMGDWVRVLARLLSIG